MISRMPHLHWILVYGFFCHEGGKIDTGVNPHFYCDFWAANPDLIGFVFQQRLPASGPTPIYNVPYHPLSQFEKHRGRGVSLAARPGRARFSWLLTH